MSFLTLFEKSELIGAHRGARSIAPENTLKALRLSQGRGDFIEIDVQLSRDKVPVLMHDETLQRTTNVAKIAVFRGRAPYNVCDFTYEELMMLECGEGEKVPTLEATLAFVKEKKLYLNIELKDSSSSFDDEIFISLILALVEKYQLHERILFSSFRHEYLRLVKEKMPQIPTAALVENHHPHNLLTYLKELGVVMYILNSELADAQTVKMLRDNGFYIGVYTINNTQRRDELFAMGVNAIFTDTLYKEDKS
ncbi:MAG TPA: glycerophosphodiester phosphodiesterase [Sulfurimonas sp. UBA12504]|nr:MAG: glycerophosphodiester phosphodiesterase [Sulfurimonas sp. GWF2_37_8]DAB30492.1 MAG TPA: glycerophosphodiester phosphodiesterase [Sulfurimonas sp. UBA12504]